MATICRKCGGKRSDVQDNHVCKFPESYVQLERFKSRVLGWDDADSEVEKWRSRALRYRKAYHDLLQTVIKTDKA